MRKTIHSIWTTSSAGRPVGTTRLPGFALGALLAGILALGWPATAAAGAVTPLPASDYTVHHACSEPTPGHAGCLALELVPATATARAHTHPLGMTRNTPIKAGLAAEGAYGLRPQDLHSAYQLPTTAPSTQTIAIVDAYDDPTAEADLGVYDHEFGLPECTSANGCFKQVNQSGESGHPPALEHASERKDADEWAIEISTDIEVAHAVCQNCHIVLVEATNDGYPDLEAGERAAAELLGANEISNSWGGSEPTTDSTTFDREGTVITAAAGDYGYLNWDAEEAEERGGVDYPASSPHVVAVGGTRLTLNSPGDTWKAETVWNGDGATGGGCSAEFPAPPWQLAESDWATVGCGEGRRAVADVAADADPYTGVAVYDSTPEGPRKAAPEWIPIGGTSVASPIIASVFALAGGADGVPYPAQTLYENELKLPDALHDVVLGSSGSCAAPFTDEGLSGCTELEEASASCPEKPTCVAHIGYDGPTGVGTPNGIAAFQTASERTGGSGEEGEKKITTEGEKSKTEGGSGAGGENPKEAGGSKGGGSGSGSGSGSGQESPVGAGQPSTDTSSAPQSGSPVSQSSSSSPNAAVKASGSHRTSIHLSNLALTVTAIEALDSSRPTSTQVAFTFALSASTNVRVTLARKVQIHGRTSWALEPGSFTFAAARGHDRAHLRSRRSLAPGHYRLTLAPAGGPARWIGFVLG
jgi:hypothetical protein